MATIYADPESAIPARTPVAGRRRLEGRRRALRARGWEQRLAPLAQHMAQKCLVRARGHAGAPLRHLDLQVLRTALSHMLSQDDDAGYGVLVYQLVVEGAEPAVVAAERGVSRLMLTEQLRDAIDQLALEYEEVAYAFVGGSKQERVRTALARKRG